MKITPEQYQAARKALGLPNAQLHKLLGVSLRQAQRYESGESAVPLAVWYLLGMFRRFGVPKELGGLAGVPRARNNAS